jgi:hypothetical protein
MIAEFIDVSKSDLQSESVNIVSQDISQFPTHQNFDVSRTEMRVSVLKVHLILKIHV